MATPQQEYERLRAKGYSHKQVMKRMSKKSKKIVRQADIYAAKTGIGYKAGSLAKGETTGYATGVAPTTIKTPWTSARSTSRQAAQQADLLSAYRTPPQDFEPATGEIPPQEYPTEFTTEQEWHYTDEFGPEGQPLPKGAVGWKPTGQPYYGEGFGGTWNEIKSLWQTSIAKATEGTPEYEAKQAEFDKAETFWQKTKHVVKHSTTADMAKILWAGAMGAFNFAEDFVERHVTTASMTIEDMAQYSNWKPLSTGSDFAHDSFREGFKSILERINPIRWVYNMARTVEAAATNKKDWTTEEVMALWQSNWAASRMGWSIGAGEQGYKAEFFARVADGEHPDLVAMDMEKPWSELFGRIVFDGVAVVSALKKGAKITGKLDTIKDTLLNPVDDIAEFIAGKGDEMSGVLRASKNIDELAEVSGKVSKRILKETSDNASRFGLSELTGTARRHQAATEAGIFGQWLAVVADGDPDKAVEIYRNMARLASDNISERKTAIAVLTELLGENVPAAFSEGGYKFGNLLRNMLLDEDGILNAKKFADEFLELQKTGDVQKVWEFLGGKMDNAIAKTFPLLDEAIEAGAKVPYHMRLLSKIELGVPGQIKGAVNWFAGRAYIGMNPGVAVRGGLYDLVQSVVDTDISILAKGPAKWAEISVKWLGAEHIGLTKGFSKAEIRGLDSIIAKETGYQDVPSFLNAIRGKDVKGIDKWTLPFARLLQRFEISSSQRLVGKATDDAMKYILRKDGAFAKIDDLVAAGLPQKAADTLVERIISNYGDTKIVKKALVSEITKGNIDLFSSGAWLDDASRRLLDEFGVMDEFLGAIKSGKPMRKVLDDVWKIRDDLFAKTENLAKQHAQAIIDEIDNPESVAQVNKILYEALEDGAPLQELLDQANDVYQYDRLTKDAWVRAGEDFVNKVVSHFEGTGNLEAADQIRQMRANGQFAGIGSEFGRITGLNRSIMDDVPKWAKKIRKASSDELPDIIAEVERIFEIDNLPKDKSAANFLWEITKGDRQGEMFRSARRATKTEFDVVVDVLRPLVPENILDDIVGSSAEVERAHLLERLASQFDNSVMIDGELKPIGEYVRALIASGDNANAIRTLAVKAKVVPTINPGTDLFDAQILHYLREGGIEAKSLADVSPEDAFDALQSWRNNAGLSRQAESLDELLGGEPTRFVHELLSDVHRIITGYDGTTTGEEAKQIVDFILENGLGEHKDELSEIRQLAREKPDDKLLDRLIDLGKRVQDNVISGTDISTAPASSRLKYELQKAGIEFSEEITQKEAWDLLHNRPSSATKITNKLLGLGEETTPARLWRGGQQVEPGAKTGGDLVYGTWDKSMANEFAMRKAEGAVVTPVEFDIKNPYMAKPGEADNLTGEAGKKFIQMLKKEGYDGIVDIGGKQVVSFSRKQAKIGFGDDVASLIPPFDGGVPTEARNIWERKAELEAMFTRTATGIRNNFGKTQSIEGITDELATALDKWFDVAASRVNDARLMSSKYAQGVRDFALHDYSNRRGFDTVLSYLYNFHFWPSRTASKWLTERIWNHPALISSYMDYREFMQDIHKDSPEWWRYSINTNELLGLNMDNPLYFRLENMLQPIYFMASSDFTDDRKRVNWWTEMLDDIGRYSPGYFNPLVQYAVAAGLYEKEEDASARWAGRLLPTTGLIQSITSVLGMKGGAGIELDPSVHIFSGGMGVYEKNRIAKTLAGYVKDGIYAEEEIIDAAYNHSGPIWEQAIADQRQQYGVGNIISTFAGINTRQRTPADLESDAFWSDYIRLQMLSADMPSEELRYNMEHLREMHPMMDALLLGRKGKDGRDTAYAWSVLSRVAPGKTDDLSKAMGLPYDMLSKFYDDEGNMTEWNPADRKRFMSAIASMGASLELPDTPTRKEWAAAGIEYGVMLDDGKEIFGEDIWDKIDMAYGLRGVGMNGDVAFQNFLENNPDAEMAMRWKSAYILQNHLLSAYYGGQEKLRDYYKGVMYQEIEDELGSNIWNTWAVYWSYINTGQAKEASAYKKQHPELKKYSEMKKEGLAEIQEKMLKYGNDLPEGIDMRLRIESEQPSFGEMQIRDYINQPQIQSFTKLEWAEMIGKEETQMAILIWKGVDIPQDIKNYLGDIARSQGLTYEELITSIGQAE